MSWTIVMSRLGHSYTTSVNRWVLDKNFFYVGARERLPYFFKAACKTTCQSPKKIHLTYSATVQRLDKRFFPYLNPVFHSSPNTWKVQKGLLEDNVTLQTIWLSHSLLKTIELRSTCEFYIRPQGQIPKITYGSAPYNTLSYHYSSRMI